MEGCDIMTYSMLAERAIGLSDENILDVARYIDFLKTKQSKAGETKKSKRTLDRLAGGLKYMADDFDAPLDELREYM